MINQIWFSQKNMLNISNNKEDLELKYKSSILEAHIILIINTLYFSFSIFIF